MEIAVAAGLAASFTAVKAALEENPTLQSNLKAAAKRLRNVLTNQQTSEDVLRAALDREGARSERTSEWTSEHPRRRHRDVRTAQADDKDGAPRSADQP